ncbi:MAG: hypothetical protein ACE5EN_08370 [Nitrospinota bacterium]
MKTAISIPNRIFKDAEKAAKRLGVSRSELYATAVNEYLKSHGRLGITEKLNELYKDGSQPLDAVLVRMQAASIENEDW